MLHEDYLVRMFLALAAAIKDSLMKAKGERDPEGAAELIEVALANTTDMDGALLLKLAPESMVSMLQLSNTDPKLIGYISRSLLLESEYLEDAGQPKKAELRKGQALALADAYGFGMNVANPEAEVMGFLEAQNLEEE